jgi:hypothetical protein
MAEVSGPDTYFGEDFGQKIDLTVRIREILRNYPGKHCQLSKAHLTGVFFAEGTSILKVCHRMRCLY